MDKMDVQLAVKSFFIGTSGIAHFFWLVPSLNSQLLAYGARGADANKSESSSPAKDEKPVAKEKVYEKFLEVASKLTVPHSWFTGFYLFSSAASAVWGQQLYTRGPLFQWVARHTNYAGKPSMTFNQIILVWALFQLHGLRRVYESFKFSKPSKAKMSSLYFGLGIMYYTCMNVSMWIEGLPALMSTSKPLGDATIGSAPSLRTMLCVPLFILSSGLQYDCHRYLFSLKKYTFPEHPAFSKVLAPHYLAEIGLYTSLTFLAAPQGQLVNKTLLIGLIFVIWNLSLAADNTKTWSEEKFGKEKVEGKNRVLPYIW